MKIVVFAGAARSLVNFRGHFISQLALAGHEVVAASADDLPGIRGELAALGASWVPIPIDRRGFNPVSEIRAVGALERAIRAHDAHSIISFTLKSAMLGGIAARRVDVDSHAVITGLGQLFIDQSALGIARRRLAMWPLKFGLQNARSVFVQNHDDYRAVGEFGLATSRQLQVIGGSGVDLERFSTTAMPDGPFRFLFVGRLIREKGLRELIAATSLLRRRGRNPTVAIAGASDYGQSSFANEIKIEAAANGIQMLGRVDDIRPAIAACHVLVLPSYREGTPRSCLEAMAMARPLVVTDVPGCREVVDPGLNGEFAQPRNVESLANAMERMMDYSRQELTRMGQESRRIAERRFDVNGVSATLQNSIEKHFRGVAAV